MVDFFGYSREERRGSPTLITPQHMALMEMEIRDAVLAAMAPYEYHRWNANASLRHLSFPGGHLDEPMAQPPAELIPLLQQHGHIFGGGGESRRIEFAGIVRRIHIVAGPPLPERRHIEPEEDFNFVGVEDAIREFLRKFIRIAQQANAICLYSTPRIYLELQVKPEGYYWVPSFSCSFWGLCDSVAEVRDITYAPGEELYTQRGTAAAAANLRQVFMENALVDIREDAAAQIDTQLGAQLHQAVENMPVNLDTLRDRLIAGQMEVAREQIARVRERLGGVVPGDMVTYDIDTGMLRRVDPGQQPVGQAIPPATPENRGQLEQQEYAAQVQQLGQRLTEVFGNHHVHQEAQMAVPEGTLPP
jgi:hypothetical protein